MGVEEATPPDYYRAPPAPGEREAKRTTPVREEKPKAAKPPYAKDYEPTTVKKPPVVTEAEMPAVKGWPLYLKILLALFLMASLFLTIRQLSKIREENKKE